jgi:antitoxin MazE
MALIKRLSRHGNSLALVIDRNLLDMLDVREGAAFSVTVAGRALVLTPVDAVSKGRGFRSSLARVNRRHGRVLQHLAK